MTSWSITTIGANLGYSYALAANYSNNQLFFTNVASRLLLLSPYLLWRIRKFDLLPMRFITAVTHWGILLLIRQH